MAMEGQFDKYKKVDPETYADLKFQGTAFEKALDTLPTELKKELQEDKTLMKRFKEIWSTLGTGAATARQKLNKTEIKKEVQKILKDYPPLSKKELPKGRGGTEALFSLGKPKPKPKPKPSQESRADIKARVKGTSKPKPSSVNDVAPLSKGGKSGTRRIKKGDTLSAIARRNNTTVAALMKMNPQIENKNEIRAGDTINVGNPKAEAVRKKEKKLAGISDPPKTIAEAKRRGMDYYVVKDSKGKEVKKAAVTADELKKSGLSLREYLNKMKKKKKMNMGGMLSAQRRQPTTSATGLSGMNMGGMKKKATMTDYRKTGMFRK